MQQYVLQYIRQRKISSKKIYLKNVSITYANYPYNINAGEALTFSLIKIASR